jgi:hypothetical protein
VVTELVPHPQTPCDAVSRVDAGVARTAPDALTVRYRIEGDLARLRIPAARPPAVGERLWQHTCCEIFVARAGEHAYREFNFSPSGEWAGYAFRGYRDGGPCSASDPRIAVRRAGDTLELSATIAVERGRLRLALSAVIEAEDGTLSYWALEHPAARPDFHHPAAFALEIE